MTTPDFTIPRKDWRRCTASGHTLYLPLGISVHPDAGFRVTVNNEGRYHRDLTNAWQDLVKRRNGISRKLGPFPCGVTPRINTGVIGLSVGIATRKGHQYVFVKVAQSLTRGQRGVSVGHCPIAELNQQWLDRTLRIGAAMRWHYWELNQIDQVNDPVKPDNVPTQLIPTKPVKPVLVDQIYELIDEKNKS